MRIGPMRRWTGGRPSRYERMSHGSTFTTSQQWFTCVRLPDPHLSSHARCVPNASRPALLMSAARVVLKPAPDSRLRRTSRHLLYSLLRRTVSRPGELHPQPLVERYVSLSTHTAPIRRTTCQLTNGCVFIRISSWKVQLDTDKTTRRRPFARRWCAETAHSASDRRGSAHEHGQGVSTRAEVEGA